MSRLRLAIERIGADALWVASRWAAPRIVPPLRNVTLIDVLRERARQDAKYGAAGGRGYTLGTGQPGDAEALTVARARYAELEAQGAITWRAVIDEELCEVFAESDPVRVRAEAIQAAAALLAMVEVIDAGLKAGALR